MTPFPESCFSRVLFACIFVFENFVSRSPAEDSDLLSALLILRVFCRIQIFCVVGVFVL